jgi:hypothetical protein
MSYRGVMLAVMLAAGCSEGAAGRGGDDLDGPSVDSAGRTGGGGDRASSTAGAPEPRDPERDAGPRGDDVDAGPQTAGGTAEAGGGGSNAQNPPTDAELPGDLLDLAAWKLTLPTGDEGSPTEIFQPELNTFALEPYFQLDEAGDGVVFRAHAGGVTTGNSSYPRCELREMAGDGIEMAAWSTTEGEHTMTLTQAITHLPQEKPHVVAGQVHDAEDDVIMIRLEDTNLFVEGGGDDLGTLDASYALGTRFTVRIEVAAGHIRVFYENLVTPVVDIERDTDGCYFKAGAYTQSNPEQGDDPDAYGEVVIYDLTVTHDP